MDVFLYVYRSCGSLYQSVSGSGLKVLAGEAGKEPGKEYKIRLTFSNKVTKISKNMKML